MKEFMKKPKNYRVKSLIVGILIDELALCA
jgi:hypothetical protein